MDISRDADFDQNQALAELRKARVEMNRDLYESALESERKIGQRVREWRTEAGWSQERLAQALSDIGFPMHQTQVAKMERGVRPTRIAEAAAVASLFGAPLHALFYSSPQEVPDVQTLETAFDEYGHMIDRAEKDMLGMAGSIARLRMRQVELADTMKRQGLRVQRARDLLQQAGLDGDSETNGGDNG